MNKLSRVYLVDTENVGSCWMQLLYTLEETDRMVLFYTGKSSKFSFDDFLYISNHVDRIRFISCFNGQPNALDFQLCAVLGYLYRKYPDREYVIVSSDAGYDPMISFMTVHGQKVSRIGMDELDEKEAPKLVLLPGAMLRKEEVAGVLGLPPHHPVVTHICQFYDGGKKYKSKGQMRQAFHNHMQQKYGTDRGMVFYNKIKDAGLFD